MQSQPNPTVWPDWPLCIEFSTWGCCCRHGCCRGYGCTWCQNNLVNVHPEASVVAVMVCAAIEVGVPRACLVAFIWGHQVAGTEMIWHEPRVGNSSPVNQGKTGENFYQFHRRNSCSNLLTKLVKNRWITSETPVKLFHPSPVQSTGAVNSFHSPYYMSLIYISFT